VEEGRKGRKEGDEEKRQLRPWRLSPNKPAACLCVFPCLTRFVILACTTTTTPFFCPVFWAKVAIILCFSVCLLVS
jgi:hypothetical protein